MVHTNFGTTAHNFHISSEEVFWMRASCGLRLFLIIATTAGPVPLLFYWYIQCLVHDRNDIGSAPKLFYYITVVIVTKGAEPFYRRASACKQTTPPPTTPTTYVRVLSLLIIRRFHFPAQLNWQGSILLPVFPLTGFLDKSRGRHS